MVRNPIFPIMLSRTSVVACLLGLLTPLAGVSGGSHVGAEIPVACSETLFPSITPDALTIKLGTSDVLGRLEIRADTADLPDEADWNVLTFGGLGLTVNRVSSDGDEGTFSASLDSGKTGALFVGEAEIFVEAVFNPGAQTMEVFVNDCSVGVVSYAQQKAITIDGLVTGPVEVTTIPLAQPVSVPPSVSAAVGAGGLAVALQAHFSKGPAMIRDGGQWVSRQQVIDKVIARLGDRAHGSSMQNAVFLDWETGNDDFDGAKAEANQGARSGPKKTWAAAKKCLKAGGVLIINGNNGVYTDDDAFGNLPPDVTIATIGDAIIGSKKNVDALFASGRWKMTAEGPVKVVIPSTQTSESNSISTTVNE